MSGDPIANVPPPVPTPPAVEAGPTLGSARIDSLDVLRGFALMGILVMNIQSFSMPADAYLVPDSYGSLEGLNAVVWGIGYVFFDMKFMAMFSMLFGAGIVLMSQHRDAAGQPVVALHFRRMLLLLAFGIIHAYLIWYGDILVAYAICGMVVFWFRRWPARRLAIAGAILIVAGSGVFTLGGLSVWLSSDAAEFYRTEMVATPEDIENEIAMYRGSWSDHAGHRVQSALGFHIFLLPFMFFWRIAGLMFLGMALFKWGILSAARSTRFYLAMALLGGGIGLPLTIAGAFWSWNTGFDPALIFGAGALPNWYGSVGVALMWIAVIMLVAKTWSDSAVASVLGAYGRTAFTNYIGQSVLATLVFYGYGLGLFGSLDRVQQVGVVVAIWAVQLTLSVVWLRYFRFGPLEWLWRSGAYQKRQPMLRRA